MKKQKLHILVAATALFGVFILGFFLGRNGRGGDVVLALPPSMQTLPAPTAEATAPTAAGVAFPININTATLEELMALPGIGEVLAKRILAYREIIGSFTAVEDLMQVEDIGKKRLEQILELITVGG